MKRVVIRVGPSTLLDADDLELLDDNVGQRHVLEPESTTDRYSFDFVDNLQALDHLAEHAVTPPGWSGSGVVQKIVVDDAEKELAGRRMGIAGAGHAERAARVSQAVLRFVFDRGSPHLLGHAGSEASALDNEVVDHAMENRPVVETLPAVLEKVRGRLRRLVLE